jgi:hypothetical protein
MSDQATLSLLEAIRTQLTVDSDSDDSKGTAVKITLNEVPHTPSNLLNTPLDRSVSSTSSIVNIENDHEPFPDFDEQLSEAYEERDLAITEAIRVAVQDDIRTSVVDPAITAPPNHSEAQRVALDRIKELLSNPDLRPTTRTRFIKLTEMIIRLEHVLFRQSEQFLAKQETDEATKIASEIFEYLGWVDDMVRDLLGVVESVFGILGFIVEEEFSEIQKYRRMSAVVAAHLRKPRLIEQRLLSLYLDLYDEWVHNRFLYLSNGVLCRDEKIEPASLALINQLHDIWQMLSRASNNYAAYNSRVNDIYQVYLIPTMSLIDMSDVPEGNRFPVDEEQVNANQAA